MNISLRCTSVSYYIHQFSSFTTNCTFSQLLNLYVIQMLVCTSPCSLQSLSLDLLNKMSTSLAQNKTMVKLKLDGDVHSPEDGKLFIRHFLRGLSGNNTLTDLTLNLDSTLWDWPEGEYNVLHCFTYFKILCALHNHNCASCLAPM